MPLRNQNTDRHSEYEKILGADEDVQDWLRAANPSTREIRFRRLGLICSQYKTTPKQLKKMTSKEAFRFLLRIKEDMEARKKAPGYVLSMLKVVKSFFVSVDIPISKRIAIKTPGKKENVPTNDELRSFLAESRLRGKAAISLLAFTGVRPEVLGDHHGSDGLKISDLLELKILNGKAAFTRIPTVVYVRKEISKTGSAYLTFLNEYGCKQVADYLNWRLSKGDLPPDAPVITADPQRAKFGQHIARKNISALVRLAMRAAGHKDFRPYVLRDWFAYRLHEGVTDGLNPDFRTFWMGRSNIELTYTLNRGPLPPKIIESMRESYARVAERHMNLEPTVMTEKEVKETAAATAKAEARREMLRTAGYTDEELEKLGDLGKMTPEKVGELFAGRADTWEDKEGKLHLFTEEELRGLQSPDMRHPLSRKELDALYEKKGVQAPRKEVNNDLFDVIAVKKSDMKEIIRLVKQGYEPVQGSDFNGSMLYRKRKI